MKDLMRYTYQSMKGWGKLDWLVAPIVVPVAILGLSYFYLRHPQMTSAVIRGRLS